MNKDMIKPLIESKSLEGFVTFNIKNNETEILNQTIEEVIKYHKKIMNYPDEIDKIVKYELNRLIEKYKRREDPFNEETIKKYYDLYKKLK